MYNSMAILRACIWFCEAGLTLDIVILPGAWLRRIMASSEVGPMPDFDDGIGDDSVLENLLEAVDLAEPCILAILAL